MRELVKYEGSNRVKNLLQSMVQMDDQQLPEKNVNKED